MKGLNKVMLIGTVGKDAEFTVLEAGLPIAKFSVATAEKWRDKNTGEQKEKTEWHKIVCYSRLAEIADKYVKKGSKIYIEGKMRTSDWTDKQNVKHYTTNIVADEIQLLEYKIKSEEKPTAANDEPSFEFNDELPF